VFRASVIGSRHREEETVMTTTTAYTVTGMTCEHCVRAVSTEVRQVPGVRDVQGDLATGQVTITSDGPVDDAAVRAAVDEAGYEVGSSR
jgi:copper chaperone CopZ